MGAVVGVESPAGAAPAAAGTPLKVSIATMAPSVVQAGTDTTITGSVTNTTSETWSGINLYGFTSPEPITDAATLATAAESDPELYVGDRIIDEGTYFTVPSLAAGDSALFTVTVPYDALGEAAGVYWIGVHALGGSSSAPSDGMADGRARTFVPLLPQDGRPVDAALVLPLRATVHHDPDGRISDPEQWTERLGADGRLTNVLRAGQAAGTRPVTWLMDPAVLEAVTRLALGNEPLSLAPLEGAVPEEEPAPESDSTSAPSGSPTGLPTESPAPSAEAELSSEDAAAAEAANAWLQLFSEAVGDRPVLSLPYGDLDMAASARSAPDLYDLAVERSSDVMTGLGIAASPALAPPSGHLSREAIVRAPRESLVLLSDTAIAPDDGTSPPSGMLLGHQVATTSSGVAAGGPGPGSPSSPIGVRQRLVSEAALRMLADDRSPIILLPPPTWNPVDPSALYDSFEDGVVRIRTLSDLDRHDAGVIDAEALAYPEEESAAELPPASFDSAQALLEEGALLSGVLELPAGIDYQVGNIALTALSYASRRDPVAARLATGRSTRGISDVLGMVTIDGPTAVTLSSDQGPLGATVSNELAEAVTVRVVAVTDGGIELEGPQSITLAPQSRRRILLDATASRQGIHTVTLRVTDADGAPLGSASTFRVRTAQVSQVIWLIMGLGAAILFGAIGLRLVRRLRGRSAGHPTEGGAATAATGATVATGHHDQPAPGARQESSTA